MLKLSVLLGLAALCCHVAANAAGEPTADQLYAKYSQSLVEELDFLGKTVLTPDDGTGNVVDNRKIVLFTTKSQLQLDGFSPEAIKAWERLAKENNVSVNQLLTIFRFAVELHATKSNQGQGPQGGPNQFDETCHDYSPELFVPTVTTGPPDMQQMFMKQFALMRVLMSHGTEFIAAPTSAGKLVIFGKMCQALAKAA